MIAFCVIHLEKGFATTMMRPSQPISLWIPVLTALTILVACFLGGFFFPAKPHVLLIGLDGVPPEIVESMMARGELPNLAAIASRGNFSKLRTHPFSHTRLVWPVIYTGVGPERDGISVEIASEFEKIAITPAMRKVPAMWDVVANNGGRAMLVSLYESYPAERQDNVVEISDRIWNLPDLSGSGLEAYSSDLVRDWALTRMNWALKNPWFEHTMNYLFTDAGYNKRITGEISRNYTVTQLLRAQLMERIRRDMLCIRDLGIAAALRSCDLLVVYFEGTDIMQHVYNDSLPPWQHSLGRRKVEQTLRIYDAALGKILDSSEPGSYICVVSDHGFDMAPQEQVNYRMRRSVNRERAQQLLDMAIQAQLHGIPYYTHAELHDDILSVSINQQLTYKQQLSAINFLRQEPDLIPEAIGYIDDHETGIYRDSSEKYDKDMTPPVGIYFLGGPGVNRAKQPGLTSIYNIAPTLIYALGLPVASDLDGKPNIELFSLAWAHNHPIKSIPSFPPRKNIGPASSLDNSYRLLEMQGLGYLDK